MKRILDKLGRSSIVAIRSNQVFRFGDVSTKSLGMIELVIQTTDHIPPISILLDVVDVDIPALIGIDVLDGNCLKVDNMSNRLWHHTIISNDPLEIVDK